MTEQWDTVGLLMAAAISFITLITCLFLMRLSWAAMHKELRRHNNNNIASVDKWRPKDERHQSGG